jgi:hypothetical protein
VGRAPHPSHGSCSGRSTGSSPSHPREASSRGSLAEAGRSTPTRPADGSRVDPVPG